jgi:hypothetical protein
MSTEDAVFLYIIEMHECESFDSSWERNGWVYAYLCCGGGLVVLMMCDRWCGRNVCMEDEDYIMATAYC